MKRVRTDVPAAPVSEPLLVVGIGASAGGLEAFRRFFASMPSDSGMAFILVQHLAPNRKSLLAELIGGSTAMPVVEAQDGMAIAADHIFVIPPDATLTIRNSRLSVVTPAPPRESRRPIDSFLVSLAADQGEKAIAIILSGAGSDGALGVAAIKEHGGLTLAQAEFDETASAGMPSSAAATGLVDHVLAVEAMPALLMEYKRHFNDAGAEERPAVGAPDGPQLDEICALLRTGVGQDFGEYKRTTLIRRIQRRMRVCQVDSVADYLDRLRQDKNEIGRLFCDLLIGVTRFFRDDAAFEALERLVLPELLAQAAPDDRIRVWVPGCATGEEAYSIAILLREAAAKLGVSPQFMLFATDINEASIAVARAGRYRKAQLEGLSSRRRSRWFSEDGEHCRVSDDIREMCVFSIHSVIKDPPFSQLSLISCRNLLIYLDARLQDRVLGTFHYALRPGGYLFLGPSEIMTRQSEVFTVLDKTHRIFKRRDDRKVMAADFPFGARTVAKPGMAAAARSGEPEPPFDRGARRVMEKYAPGYIVVDLDHRVVQFSGQVGKYLEPSDGEASFSLFSLIQMPLRTAARAALRDAARLQQRAVQQNVPIEVDGRSQTVNLIVEPILHASGTATHYVVAFQDVAEQRLVPGGTQAGKAGARSGGVRQLENELRATKGRLQAAIDQLEAANQELKSANEEFQSVNEELQSSNEELETSKEEMQSMNEELNTINSELLAKNADLMRVNGDLANFLESTEIATLFLDGDLCIRSFTAAMTELFHLRPADRGRPVTEIVSRLSYRDIEEDAKAAIRTLGVVEREVRLPQNGATYIMRIRPYRIPDGRIDGVVVTFVDITDRKRQEIARGELAAIVDSSQEAIIGHTLEGTITSWNESAVRLLGVARADALGRPLAAVLPESCSAAVTGQLEKLRQGKTSETFDVSMATEHGLPRQLSLSMAPVRDAAGTVIAASTIGHDITERALAEEHRMLLMAELDHRVKNTLAAVQSIARHTGTGAASIEAFREAFEARLMAMSRTHDLLTQAHWRGAPLREIVMRELRPYAGGQWRFTVDGEEVALSPKQAMALGLAFHELATNAAKYGAFSVPKGRVEVTWTMYGAEDRRVLDLVWIEIDGPRLTAPHRAGFGSKLIEQGLRTEIDAEVRLDYRPEGLRFSLQFPLDGGDA